MHNLTTFRKNIGMLLIGGASLFIFRSSGNAQPPPVLIFTPIVSSGLGSSVDVVNARDGTNRLFIVDKGGFVRIVSGGVLLPGNFLDIPDSISTGSERGLLSIAFHPNFAINRYFFIYYTNTAGDIRISRFQTLAGNPNVTDESTGVVLLTIPHPGFSNHNGGQLIFGPDGNLYFGTGDGGSGGDPSNNAQNGNSLLGKMMRLNVDNFTTPPYYTIPADNPYVLDPAVRDEIYALGLRNPWRWSFDRFNNAVWIADVGQNAWEEINSRPFLTSGGINYGWRCYEGNAAYNTTGCQPQSSYISPIFVYPHNNTTGGFSVTGGYVYRGAEFPALYGYYICSDYISGNTWLIKPNGGGGWIISQQSGLPGSIVSFGENENGDLYALSLTGILYKVNTSSVLPLTLQHFTAKGFAAFNELQWKTVFEQDLSFFEIEYSINGIDFVSAGKVNALNNPVGNTYSFKHFNTINTIIYYRLRITDKDGRSSFSTIIEIDNKDKGVITIYPSPVTGNRLNIISGNAVDLVTLYSATGKKVFQSRLNNLSGVFTITLPLLQKGIYFIQLKVKEEYLNRKIIIQ